LASCVVWASASLPARTPWATWRQASTSGSCWRASTPVGRSGSPQRSEQRACSGFGSWGNGSGKEQFHLDLVDDRGLVGVKSDTTRRAYHEANKTRHVISRNCR